MARYYGSSEGRYTQPDPLGLGGGDLSLYTYAHSAPTKYIDPDGLQVKPRPGLPGFRFLAWRRRDRLIDGLVWAEVHAGAEFAFSAWVGVAPVQVGCSAVRARLRKDV